MNAALALVPNSPQQAGFAFPQSLTEKYQPRSISDFVGLEKPKRMALRMAENPYPSAWLFVGPSGTGKTTLALALAEAIPAELHHIPSQECNLENLERIRRICQYVPMSGKRMHMILVDEANFMSPAAQMSLYSKLDATNFPPNTIFIFTTNDIDRLAGPFLSRVRTLEFSSYGIAKDVTALLSRVWTAETGGAGTPPNFARICKESTNNCRAALMALETELMCS